MGATLSDITYLEHYFENYKDDYNNTLSIKDMMDYYNMSDRMEQIKVKIQTYMAPNQI